MVMPWSVSLAAAEAPTNLNLSCWTPGFRATVVVPAAWVEIVGTFGFDRTVGGSVREAVDALARSRALVVAFIGLNP